MHFVTSLTLSAGELAWVHKLWNESEPTQNPFQHILVTPLFTPSSVLDQVFRFKEEYGSEVYFDSGGYYVQQGKVRFEELFEPLKAFYLQNQWADWYVLPDHVPTSKDTPAIVEQKVLDTLTTAYLFLNELPSSLRERVIPVVHGHTLNQNYDCIEQYAAMGANYVGFGSFGTSNLNHNTNVVDEDAIQRVAWIMEMAKNNNMRVHLFGVATPPLIYLFDLLDVHSFDSLSWMRSAGYGKIFLPFMRGYNVSHRSLRNSALTELEFLHLRELTHHDCAFCRSFRELSRSKRMRALHNLIVISETVAMLDLPSVQIDVERILQLKSQKYHKLLKVLDHGAPGIPFQNSPSR